MAKFSLRNFVMKTLQSMKDGGEDEYKIMQYALKYYEKDVLTEDDLAEVQLWFEETETGEPELPNEDASDNPPDLSDETVSEGAPVAPDIVSETVDAAENK